MVENPAEGQKEWSRNLSQDIRNRLEAHYKENMYAQFVKAPKRKSLPFLLSYNV